MQQVLSGFAVVWVIIAVGFLAGLVVGEVSWGEAAGGLLPRLEGTNSLVLAASMLGATTRKRAPASLSSRALRSAISPPPTSNANHAR